MNLTAQQAGQKTYRIKPIVWTTDDDGGCSSELPGGFCIDPWTNGWRLHWCYDEYVDDGWSDHPTLEEAKACAERIHTEHALQFLDEVQS